jgi:hypothetical protein
MLREVACIRKRKYDAKRTLSEENCMRKKILWRVVLQQWSFKERCHNRCNSGGDVYGNVDSHNY